MKTITLVNGYYQVTALEKLPNGRYAWRITVWNKKGTPRALPGAWVLVGRAHRTTSGENKFRQIRRKE